MKFSPKVILGVTGGIGSGKSFFTRRFAAHLGDAPTMDADHISRGLLADDPEVRTAVRERFGPGVFTDAGAVSRDALREIVFADPTARRDLEGILHPRVRRRWLEWIAEGLRAGPGRVLLVETPLLYETGAESHFDRVVVVACQPETQERRLRETRGLPSEVARRIFTSQLPVAEKIRRADHVVWNDADDPAALERQAELLATLLKPRTEPG